MSSVIRIKRSSTTASPTTLASGELAYSWASSTGGKLYIGWGAETIPGEADNIDPIGGKYYTDKMNHTPGILTANAAIITDANNSIDQLIVDNITIDGNTIASTANNVNLVFSLLGTGAVDVDGAKIINLATPTSNNDAANKIYVDTQIAALQSNTNLSISGDSGSDVVILASDILSFSGGTGLSSIVANNSITFNIDNTGVNAATYGSSTDIPVLTINAQGQITFAGTASISTDLSIAGDSGTDAVSLLTDTLTFTGGTGVTTAVSNNNVTFSIGQDVSTSSNVTFNDVTVNGTLFSNDITAETVTITGNLVVQGNTTIVNTEEIFVADNIILLNSNLEANTAPTTDAGIAVNRGSSPEVTFLWDETNDRWTLGARNLVANEFIGTIDGGTY